LHGFQLVGEGSEQGLFDLEHGVILGARMEGLA
jgi:hypothetical protein